MLEMTTIISHGHYQSDKSRPILEVPMGYSIELYFEKRFDEKILLLWNRLKELGLPSVFKDINSKPHLSLAVLENIDEKKILEVFDTFIKSYTSFEFL